MCEDARMTGEGICEGSDAGRVTQEWQEKIHRVHGGNAQRETRGHTPGSGLEKMSLD